MFGFPKKWTLFHKLLVLKSTISSAVQKIVSGAILSIKDALAMPAIALSVDVDPVQDLHGYDYPWPEGGSPNLYNGSNYTLAAHQYIRGSSPYDVGYYADTTNRSIIMSCAPSSKYSVTSGAKGTMRVGSFQTSPAAGSTPTVFATATSSSDPVGLEITTGANDKYLFIQFFIDGDVTNYGSTLENSLNGFVLKKDSNICPISGWTGCNVYHTGKNLFPATLPANRIAGQISSNGTIISATNARVFAIPCKQNTYFYFSQETTGTGLTVAFGDKLPVVGDSIAYQGNMTNRTEWELNSGSHTYLLLAIANENQWQYFATNKLQIEVGESKTDYEAPKGLNTYSITFPDAAGTVYGGTLDVTNGVLTVTRAKQTFTWGTGGTSLGSYTRKSMGIGTNASGGTIGNRAICTVAPYNPNYTGDFLHFYIDGTQMLAYLPNETAADLQFDVVYFLKTPQTYQLTPQEVTLLLGENTLWADTGNTTLTYLADGTADDIQALNILLGGRYVNNGAPDEATDAEALNILLGR